MRHLFYKTLAYTYYYIGDITARLCLCDWCYRLYQYSMMKSMYYDDMSGNNVWTKL